MKVFLTGATGAIGRRLVPLLLRDGHEVIALVRTAAKAEALQSMGARVSIADALDREALTGAVRKARPEAILHELTALAGVLDVRRFDRGFALTNRLRTEATDTLLAAGRLAGTRRFIAQSFCGWPFARRGGPVKTEEDPLDPEPPRVFAGILAAIRHLEEEVRNADDLHAMALRYGSLYGPGTALAKDGALVAMVRGRKMPILGAGAGVWSFLHVEDAARATVAALSRGGPGIYNVVDDEPAPVSAWLPALAEAVGARPPVRVPVWLGRLLVGDGGVSLMTQVRGGSNAKAKRELGWEPTYSSWRRGFVEGLG